MADDEFLTQSVDELVHDLAWGLNKNAGLLPEAPRQGRIRPSFEDCLAIARKQVELLKARGVLDLRRRGGRLHSWPREGEGG